MPRETLDDLRRERDEALARAAHFERELIRLQTLISMLKTTLEAAGA